MHLPEIFRRVMAQHGLQTRPTERIAIAGSPRAGKTGMAGEGDHVRHTDDLIPLGWSEASQAASEWFSDERVTTVEGTAVPRALRKWLKANPEGKPCDRVVFLSKPVKQLSRGQSAMAKGCNTVMTEIEPELVRRGVVVERR